MKIKNVIVGITSLSLAATASLPVLGEVVNSQTQTQSQTQSQTTTQTQMVTQVPTQSVTQMPSQTQTQTQASDSSTKNFTDVPSTHPNYKAIMGLKKLGIIQGYANGTYLPDKEVSRVEALKIILLGAKINVPDEQGVTGFSDTQRDWSHKYIMKALAMKIVKGYADKTFRPFNTVNISENLIMIVNAWGLDLSNLEVKTKPFADVELDAWYTKIFDYAKSAKWLTGDNNNMIHPTQPMTRAKLAQLVYNALQSSNGNLTNTQSSSQTTQNDGTITIRDFNYVDSIINIKVGGTVTWINKDPTLHTITSDSGTFLNSGEMSFDQEYKKTFTEAGEYKYHCNKYPFMKGTVRVTQ